MDEPLDTRLPANLGPFHHVGVAVHSIADTVNVYTKIFGARVDSELFHDPMQGVRIQFVMMGGLRVELLEPAAEPSPVDGVLKRGLAIYHVCYEVADLDAALVTLGGHGVSVVSQPKPAVAFGGRRVAFIMCRGLMVELLESTLVGSADSGGGS